MKILELRFHAIHSVLRPDLYSRMNERSEPGVERARANPPGPEHNLERQNDELSP
jgi:hypothetical protein